ncbi:hypothetical protein [Nocardia sp. NBC_01327]|uniref:hypothetical protein n=1 Tax=Nocardia sp. NBC_01327 TaxID=2903593 RepID=UPI002E140A7C|nr:hypothetical protein OG326_21270 [Nocardia sp. NBC_01327]
MPEKDATNSATGSPFESGLETGKFFPKLEGSNEDLKNSPEEPDNMPPAGGRIV